MSSDLEILAGAIMDKSLRSPKPPSILAHSPWVGGPGTRVFRIVLLKWPDGEYSVHHQFKEDMLFETGIYNPDYVTCCKKWLQDTTHLIKTQSTHLEG